MSDEPTTYNLLLSRLDTGAPVLPEGAGDELVAADAEAAGGEAEPLSFRSASGDRNDLSRQGWGIVLPKGGRGDAIKAKLADLIAHRARQQGEAVREWRVDPVMDHAQALTWRKTKFDDLSGDDEVVPLYVLVAGDLDEVPLAVDQVLAMDTSVGRLAFDEDAHYAAYAAKVLHWEAQTPVEGGGPLVVHSVRDGSAATKDGYANMVEPMDAVFQQRLGMDKLNASSYANLGDELDPGREDFLGSLGRFDTPGVFFTMSHGSGAPGGGWTSEADQRSLQGSLSLGGAGTITGADLAGRPVVPGGVWFMFACFGAGTPAQSVFHHWLAAFNRGNRDAWAWVKDSIPERPFIAGLPKTVLAKDDGPLAFIGHLDLAWTYGYTDAVLKQKTPGTYYRAVNELLKGNRAGVGFGALQAAHRTMEGELADIYDAERRASLAGLPPATDDKRKANIWMRRNDLRAYILLGDPAARLPVREAARTDTPAPFVPPPAETPTPAPEPTPAEVGPRAPAGVDPDDLMDAIYRALSGELSAAAADLGLEKKELRALVRAYDAAGRAAIEV